MRMHHTPRSPRRLFGRRTSVLAVAILCTALAGTWAGAQDAGWTGNRVRNPGFEEDFVNAKSEGHVLSFKGDWFYNQKDLVPDYWPVEKGSFLWLESGAHSGRHAVKLPEGSILYQSFPRAISQSGGGAWGGVDNTPIPITSDETARFAQPWRASVWVRGGGTLTLGPVKAQAPASADWQQLTVECPADQVPAPSESMTVRLTGPGEFDDLVVQEKIPAAPNLAPNPSFEKADGKGHPAGWSPQKKWHAIGPTYYVWTDWNHAFSPNRGPVTVDRFIANSGEQSLRFDVFPGDEKFVESDLIPLNQDKPHVIEVGVFVRADRVRLIDIRCVDEDGVHMPGYRPIDPENGGGGTALYGNGTFGWRYVHKFFATPQGRAVKGIRVRLCARGFNGHTLDDADTRSYCMQAGTVWWDDLRVCERTTDAAALRARGVSVPSQDPPRPGPREDTELDLGQRLFGDNALSYSFVNKGGADTFRLKLTTTLPGQAPVATESKPVAIAAGQRGTLEVPYAIPKLAGELLQQASFQLELLRKDKAIASATYAFNTWPVIVDIDVARHYNLPQENPVTVSLNLGVSDLTLAKVKTLELQLYRPSDKKVLGRQQFNDLPAALTQTLQSLPKTGQESYEFNLPTPAWWVDRFHLLLTKLDLGPLKVWPHDEPTRDTVLLVRGLDAGGAELFRQQSDPFCRMQQRPPQEPIDKVEVRDDGALLINGKPRYLVGASHQNMRLSHTAAIMAQLGLMGLRLPQGVTFDEIREYWEKYNLYALQLKPVSTMGGVAVVEDMTPEQRQAFEAFVQAGGMKSVVSINTGGWEACLDLSRADTVAKHVALNDWIRKVARRPVAISTSGAYNAWWLPKYTFYDMDHAETEMWGPMDFNVIYTPYMKRAGRTTTWVYLPQLYDNHPYERYRFETYENILRGACGVSMIQGIGDPTFNRGLAGELRCLEAPLNSLEKTPEVALSPNIGHKVTRHKGKTYVLASNGGPILLGRWNWNTEIKHSGKASHEGESVNLLWGQPGGVRIHGFRGLPLPELIQKGDTIVQYVWIDPAKKPDWVMVAVRGDGRFAHNGVLGAFNFDQFRADYGNILMFSELNHSVWHAINYVMDDATYQRAVKVMGQAWADGIKKQADAGRAAVDKEAYQAEHFHALGALPKEGTWTRMELDAEKAGLVGTLVDGFAYLSKNGRALWDYSVLERNGKVVRVFSEDSAGIDRAELATVRIEVPGLKAGTPVKALFEDRTITADAGGFTDNFEGVDTYGFEAGAVVGDLFGFVKDEDRELARMMPSGTAYNYGPTAIHIYEIAH